MDQYESRVYTVTNRKQRGPQRNSGDISSINVSSSICFHLNCLGNGNDNISSKVHFENSKKNLDWYSFTTRTDYFCPNILNPRDPVLLMVKSHDILYLFYSLCMHKIDHGSSCRIMVFYSCQYFQFKTT